MKKGPPIDLTAEKLEGVLDRVRPLVGPADFEIIEAVFQLLLRVVELFSRQKATLAKLRRMLFGPKSEKTRDVFPGSEEGEKGKSSEGDAPAGTNDESKLKPKRPGHGRMPAAQFTGATTIQVPHPELKPGSSCPACCRGRVRRLKEPARGVRFVGQPFIAATVYEGERYRCNRCQEVFSTTLPVPAGTREYQPTARSLVTVLKYGMGLPFNRLEKFQRARGVPLPSSVQWQMVRDTSKDLFPVYDAMVLDAAQNRLVYNDDTNAKIQALMPKSRKKLGATIVTPEPVVAAGPGRPDPEDADDTDVKDPKRTGIFTSTIVSVGDGYEIVLYFTGRKHAGENLAKVLSRRDPSLPPVHQMCDGLDRNLPKGIETIHHNCLSHGRRNVVDVAGNFPDECRHILEEIREVYKVEKEAKRNGLDPDARLALHRTENAQRMADLEQRMKIQLEERIVEPNSDLGRVYKYLLKRWSKMTRFLEIPGAPLDNNTTERGIKLAILNRKNAYFYRTLRGARVGDRMMTIIETCWRNKVDPVDYITSLLEHLEEVRRCPEDWFPWRYKETLAKLVAERSRDPPPRPHRENSRRDKQPSDCGAASPP